MPFPEKTLLTRPVRIAIMVCFILAFFVIAPLVVLYTMGYRFDIHTREIQTTGVLNIDIEPETALVTLNGTLLRDRMPIKLFNRAPGTYTVEISAEGYHTWKKDIQIESNQTTYIKGLHLFTNTQPQNILTETLGQIDTMSLSPNGDSGITLARKDGNTEIGLYQILETTWSTLGTTTAEITDIVIEWNDDGSHVSIMISEPTQTRLIVGSSTSGPDSFVTYTTPQAESITYQWSSSLFQDETLYLGTPELHTRISGTSISSSTPSTSSSLWYVDNGSRVLSYDETTGSIIEGDQVLWESITKRPEEIVSVTDRMAILRYGQHIVRLIKQTDGSMETATLPGPHSVYIPYTQTWVTYTPWEVTLLYEDGTYNTIYRTDTPIQTILPLGTDGTLLIVKSNQLIGFNPGFYTNQILAQDIEIQNIGLNRDTQTIYIYGSKDDTTGLFTLGY